MKVRITNRSNHGLPTYQTKGSAGLDLRAHLSEPLTLGPGERKLVPTGVSIELPEGYEAQVRPRSGLALKNGITVLNAPGTIDSDYRGEVGVILVNLSNESHEIADGQRIAQMVVASYSHISWDEVEILEETARGSGGYGSTGG